MLLLSREDKSPLKMSAELVPADKTVQSKEKLFSFDLVEEFTNKHQINLVFEDKHKQRAIFVTQSVHYGDINLSENRLIDSVAVLKLDLAGVGKLTLD